MPGYHEALVDISQLEQLKLKQELDTEVRKKGCMHVHSANTMQRSYLMRQSGGYKPKPS